MKGFSLEEGIERTLDAEFSAFELTPITYGGPEAFDLSQREDLRNRMSAFHQVTVHSSGMGNIGSDDGEMRKSAQQRYLELVRLARDVGADVVTVHTGRPEPEVFDVNVAVGQEMVALAEGSGMALGFELFDVQVARTIGHSNFGALFDIGHASRRGPEIDTDDVCVMIEEMADQIVQFHIHGVGDPDKSDHLSFAENIWLDYGCIMQHIDGMAFDGPMILEIGIRDDDGLKNLKDCVTAREALIEAVG